MPPERRADRAAFIAELCEQLIPRAATATSVDVWCEDGAYTLAETRQIFSAARRAGKGIRGHVGQLSELGAPEPLAELGALSADHLEYISDAGIAALARAGTVAVMPLGACVQLRLPVPPIAKLRGRGAASRSRPTSTRLRATACWLSIQMWLATTHFVDDRKTRRGSVFHAPRREGARGSPSAAACRRRLAY